MIYNPNPKKPTFITLQIIHGALCMGVILFLGVTSTLNTGQIHSAILPNDVPLIYVAIALAAILTFISGFLYNKKLAEIDLSAPVGEKLAQYITASIIRYALLEAAALFNVVVWLLTANLISVIVAAALILYMVGARPVKNKVVKTFQISYPETLD